MHQSNFVFGYGSLVNWDNLQQYLGRKLTPGLDFVICGLHNFHRCWNIAMDNRLDLPNYKYYIEEQTGNRFNGFVTFLNIRFDQDKTIIGILFRVSEPELENLDQRERNYQRIDITHLINRAIQGKAWVYLGLEQAKNRYHEGLQKNCTAISQEYFDLVNDAYYSLGNCAFSNYLATTDKLEVPTVNLKRCKVGIS
ncbi:gamma-glutamylcyclotransferase family protein [Pleurocapsa sp. PCC 7319]|uniref:gamma-glutamylcyclotransferase family protein n=1 Tax=Pleurocapsa sp. PCC 7319 TaxID=118161 RepID=UPI000349C141|nr:gamma-glutamylcyclotransferase family protein [Pleurocapsa sp. PCC 7319]